MNEGVRQPEFSARIVERVAVPPSDPWSVDKLERKAFAEALTAILLSTHRPVVVCLNGAWGSGKSVFLEMLQRHLESKRLVCIYFDAWRNDYSPDPLVSMLASLQTEVEISKNGRDPAAPRAYMDDLKRVGAKLLPTLAGLAAGATLLGVGGPSAAPLVAPVANATREVAETVSREAKTKGALPRAHKRGALATSAIDEYSHVKGMIAQFVSNLEGLAASLAPTSSGPGLIVLVDELDRCRPDFALELLERLKHLFCANRVCFLVATDHVQLQNVARARYGPQIDAPAYLQRFFDFVVQLPPASPRVYAEHIFSQLGLDEIFPEPSAQPIPANFQDNEYAPHFQHEFSRPVPLSARQEFIEGLGAIGKAARLSLRQQEKIAQVAALVGRCHRHDLAPFHALLLPLAAMLEIIFPEVAEKLLSRSWSPIDVFRLLPALDSTSLLSGIIAAAQVSKRFDLIKDTKEGPAVQLPRELPFGKYPSRSVSLQARRLWEYWSEHWRDAARGLDPLEVLARQTRTLGSTLLASREA